MRRATPAAAALLVALMGLAGMGCDKPKPPPPAGPEPTYQGRPLGDWLARTSDRDAATRKEAYQALGNFTGSDVTPKTVAALKSGVDSDPWPLARAEAAKSLLATTGDAGPGVQLARTLLQSALTPDASRGQKLYAARTIIAALGPAAAELGPDVKKIRSAVVPNASIDPSASVDLGYLNDIARAMRTTPSPPSQPSP